MANKKITELPTMSSASLAPVDLLVVVDRSFSETKSMAIGDLMGYLVDNLTVTNAEHASNSENAETAEQADSATSSSYSEVSSTSVSSSYSDIAGTSFVGGNESTVFSIRNVSDLERDNLTNVKLGSVIYNTTSASFQGYSSNGWVSFN